MMKSMPGRLVLSIITSLLLVSSFAYSQTAQLDSLRVSSGESARAKCDLCYWFTKYEMADSAFACLESLRSDALSEDLELYALMVEANANLITYEEETVDSLLNTIEDQMLRVDMDPELRFRIEEEAILFYRYYVRCYDALDWINFLIDDAAKNENPKKLIDAVVLKATMVRCIHEKDDVTEYYQQAENIVADHSNLRGYYHRVKGSQLFYEETYPLALTEFLKAADYLAKDKRHTELMRLCYSIGDLYSELNTPRKTLVYFNRCKKFFEEEELHDLGTFYNSYGWAFYELMENDSAIRYFHKSLRVHRDLSPSNPEIAYPIGNLGLVHRKLGNLDSAYYYSNKAIELYKVLNLPSGIAEAENNLGFTTMKEGKIQQSLRHFERALEISEKAQNKYEQLSAHHGLYMLKAESNPREALGHYQQFSILQNALLTTEDELKALQYEADLLLDQNEQLIKQLELDSELKSLKIERQQFNLLLITIGLILVLLITGMIFFYYLSRRRLIEKLNESNEIAQRIISMISHDFRGPLGNIRMMLSLLQEDNLEKEEFDQLSTALFRQTTDVSLMYDSFIVWAMSQSEGYTPSKDKVIWSDIVEEAVSIAMPIANMKQIEIQVNGAERIEMTTDRMAGNLILRNLLSNAIKYSHEESKIEISFSREGDEVKTIVRDWGIGISDDIIDKILNARASSRRGTRKEYGSGLGLRLVVQFIDQLGGRIEVESQEGKGSKFTIHLPME